MVPNALLFCSLAVVLFTVRAAAAGGFFEPFDGRQLDSRWEWFTPKPGPVLSLTDSPGHLRVTLPRTEDGYNHWVGEHGADAPLLLTPAPEGDFALETHLKLISFGRDSNFHLALIVAFSRRYLLGWGPFFAPLLGNPAETPEVWCEPTGHGRYVAVQGDATDVYLRIAKVGRRYSLSLRRAADEPWTEAGDWSSAWPAQYVGFMGKTFGSGSAVVADIDYIKLAPTLAVLPEPLRATITLDCSGPTWPLHPWRFGHFIEHLGRCIYHGIWAEMLSNRKFSGPVNPQGVVESWEAVGQRPGVRFSRDNAEFYCPCQSQRIELDDTGQPAGIVQKGLVLRAQVPCEVRLVAKQRGLRTPVLLALRDNAGRVVSQAEVSDIGEEWTVRNLQLAGPAEQTAASLAILTSGPGTLWLGAVSLMPADNVDGMRADVLEAIREIKPSIIRWPGGNFVSGYDWRDGIGERDLRPVRWDRAWNAWEWNDFGTDEFLGFCRLVGCEPYICVNAGEGTAREAAAWVEYCNGPADSTWGRLRAQHGHPEPYGVKVWGIGNEMYGNWQLGHLSATNYGLKAVEFARAMRTVDPTIRLVGVGVEGDGWGEWNREVCRIAGPDLDWLSVHYYLGLPEKDQVLNYGLALGAPAHIERSLALTHEIARQATGRALPLAFDEWNIWLPGPEYTLREALFACCVFNALHRLGDKCPMANLAQLVNVLGAIYTDPTRVVRTPLHRAFELYTANSGPIGLAAQVQAPTVHFPNAGNLPALDVSASLSQDRRTVYLAIVNRHPTEAVQTRLDLRGFHAANEVRSVVLNAEGTDTANTLERPQEVRLVAETLSLAQATEYACPPHSATVLVFEGR